MVPLPLLVFWALLLTGNPANSAVGRQFDSVYGRPNFVLALMESDSQIYQAHRYTHLAIWPCEWPRFVVPLRPLLPSPITGLQNIFLGHIQSAHCAKGIQAFASDGRGAAEWLFVRLIERDVTLDEL